MVLEPENNAAGAETNESVAGTELLAVVVFDRNWTRCELVD